MVVRNEQEQILTEALNNLVQVMANQGGDVEHLGNTFGSFLSQLEML